MRPNRGSTTEVEMKGKITFFNVDKCAQLSPGCSSQVLLHTPLVRTQPESLCSPQIKQRAGKILDWQQGACRIRTPLEINKPPLNAFAFTFVMQHHRIIAAPFLREEKVTF